jgi:hypothetical protein
MLARFIRLAPLNSFGHLASKREGQTKRRDADDVVAGNGLLHRRALLGVAGLATGATAARAAPLADDPWSTHQGGNVKQLHGLVSNAERALDCHLTCGRCNQ